jgi:hypothetical protein
VQDAAAVGVDRTPADGELAADDGAAETGDGKVEDFALAARDRLQLWLGGGCARFPFVPAGGHAAVSLRGGADGAEHFRRRLFLGGVAQHAPGESRLGVLDLGVHRKAEQPRPSFSPGRSTSTTAIAGVEEHRRLSSPPSAKGGDAMVSETKVAAIRVASTESSC